MSTQTIKIHNSETNEVIEREMNAKELAQWEADQAAQVQQKAKIESNIAAKTALLDKLGITEEEARLLLG